MKKIIDFREDVEEKPGEMRLPRKKTDETRRHRKKIRQTNKQETGRAPTARNPSSSCLSRSERSEPDEFCAWGSQGRALSLFCLLLQKQK